MFEPKYTITPTLLASIKRTAVLTAELNRKPMPPQVIVELERRAATLSAHTSTRIEGNPLPLSEVKRLLKLQPHTLRQTEREVVNYNAALRTLDTLIGKGPVTVTIRRILDIHKGVMKGLLEPYYCGRIRAEPVVVNDPRSGRIVYLPPDQQDVESLMKDLVSFIARNRNRLDPLLLAGIFHKQLVIIHPFTDGNGRTARLATKVLLAEMGLDTFRLFSFENYYDKDVTRYFATVGESGNYYETRDGIDFTSWLEYFAAGIVDELLRVAGELEADLASPGSTPQPHHEKILEHIRAHGYITDRDYARLTERAKATRTLDFNKLVEWGLIERHGKGRNTHYKTRG